MSKYCQTCGTLFFKKKTCSLREWNEQAKFCSYSCRRFTPEVIAKISTTKKYSSTTIRGEKHHNWKGGISDAVSHIRGSLAYRKWRDSVYRRDGWSCTECGEHCAKGNIVAHHIKKFSDFPESRFVVENGVTLCRACHATIENPKRITHT